MAESWHTRLRRWGFNFFPAYRGSGARFTYITDDWREVRIKLPLNWRTRNYVGTIYGGSMYSAVDPIYGDFQSLASDREKRDEHPTPPANRKPGAST